MWLMDLDSMVVERLLREEMNLMIVDELIASQIREVRSVADCELLGAHQLGRDEVGLMVDYDLIVGRLGGWESDPLSTRWRGLAGHILTDQLGQAEIG